MRERIGAIECIRGLSMMGVVGIHVGSQYLMNPSANENLVAIFEVATRFSVPIFFFVSAFGIFYGMDDDFSYARFFKRRLRAVLLPYLAWSAFYIVHYTLLYDDRSILSLRTIAKYLFFGFASYQLYFMVILLWFYILMPVWIAMVRRATPASMAALLAFQIVFDYWSSYVLDASHMSSPYLRALVDGRLNYWVLHYIFVFVMGGWLAVNLSGFRRLARSRRAPLVVSFFLSLAALLGQYYYVIRVRGYTPIESVNTAHQLSPAGVIYTVAASLFFFSLFDDDVLPAWTRNFFAFLGRHSSFMYLAHPVAITYLSLALSRSGRVMTAPIAILFYFSVLVLTLFASSVYTRATSRKNRCIIPL